MLFECLALGLDDGSRDDQLSAAVGAFQVQVRFDIAYQRAEAGGQPDKDYPPASGH